MDFQERITQREGWEILSQPFYDSAVYPVAGSHGLDFFCYPAGSVVHGEIKTPADTNIETVMMPADREFLIRSISVDFHSMAHGFGDDAANFYRSGYLRLLIGSRSYLSLPLSRFIPKLNPPLAAIFVSGGPYDLGGAPLLVRSHQSFCVSALWPKGLQPIANPARVTVYLGGVLYRRGASYV